MLLSQIKNQSCINISYVHKGYINLCCMFAGVFVLLQVYAFLQYLKDRLTQQEFQTLFFLGVSVAAGVVLLSVVYLTYTGRFEWKPGLLTSSHIFFLYQEINNLFMSEIKQQYVSSVQLHS